MGLIEHRKIVSIISQDGKIIGLDEVGNIWEYFAEHDDWYAVTPPTTKSLTVDKEK